MYTRKQIFIDFVENEKLRVDKLMYDEINPLMIEEGQKSVPYHCKTNLYGFRSDEFINEHSGKHIVFAGCSETYGQGGDLEDIWAHKVYSKIKEKENLSGFFNLGKCGAGVQDIIHYILSYSNKFGKPDALFILLPNLTRFISYLALPDDLQKHSGWFPVSYSKLGVQIMGGGNMLNTEDSDRWDFQSHMDHYSHMVLYMRLVEQWCKDSGIDLFWGTWEQNGRMRHMSQRVQMDIDSQIDFDVSDEEVFDLIQKNPELTIRKPDLHFGTAYHTVFANRFLDAYEKK
jgi:hypothetical protein